jgi:hypothetical protein
MNGIWVQALQGPIKKTEELRTRKFTFSIIPIILFK